ncbi:uncharacterized protein [Cherax quadricarinatus]|uniref:uncharacterized protein n=1 Tax=Cherax quadricarinatus TaxID=27406 RepID=UPI00387E8F93
MLAKLWLMFVVACICLHAGTQATAAPPAAAATTTKKDVLLTQLLRALELYNGKGAAQAAKNLLSTAQGYSADKGMRLVPSSLPDEQNIKDMAVLVYLSSSKRRGKNGPLKPEVRIDYVPKELVFGKTTNSSAKYTPVQYFAVKKAKLAKHKEGNMGQDAHRGEESVPLSVWPPGESINEAKRRNHRPRNSAHSGDTLLARPKRSLWSSYERHQERPLTETAVQLGDVPRRKYYRAFSLHRRHGPEADSRKALIEEESAVTSRQFGFIGAAATGLLSQVQFALANPAVLVAVIILNVSRRNIVGGKVG